MWMWCLGTGFGSAGGTVGLGFEGLSKPKGFNGAVILFCGDKILVEKLPLIPLLKHSMELKLKLPLAAKPKLQQDYSH